MKTSFEKFMASSAVKSIEPTKVEMGAVKVELALTDDLIKSIQEVGVVNAKASILNDKNVALLNEYEAVDKKLYDAKSEIDKVMQSLIKADEFSKNVLAKLESQLKGLGLTLADVPQIQKELQNMKNRSVGSTIKNLEFFAKAFGQAIK